MKKMIFVAVFISLTSSLSMATSPIDNTTTLAERYIRLQQDLLNQTVIKYKLPLSIMGHNSITITFVPFQILQVDEVLQSITLSSIIFLAWSSTQLAWDPLDYGYDGSIKIDSTSVWTPVVVLPKSVEDIYIEIPKVIELYPNHFEAKIPLGITTTCELDLEFFPFDSHNCSIIFKEMQDYHILPNDSSNLTFTQYFATTTEWEFSGSSCERRGEQKGPNDNEDSFLFTECWFQIERRSLFYLVLVIVPIIAMDVMALFVFVIPPESGEKVSYIVSIFLSLAIFNVYVNDILPRSMTRIPRIISLIGQVLFKVMLYMLATFFVIRIYHRQQPQQETTDSAGCMEDKNDTTPAEKAQNVNDECAVLKTNSLNSNSQIFPKLKQNKVGIFQTPNTINDNTEGRKDSTASMFPVDTKTHRAQIIKKTIAAFKRFCTSITASQLDVALFIFFLFVNICIYFYFARGTMEARNKRH